MNSNEPVPRSDPKRVQRALGYGLILLGVVIVGLVLLGVLIELSDRTWTFASGESIDALIGGAIFGGLPLAVGLWLRKRAGPAPVVEVKGRQPMSAVRLVFAAFGALIMLFAGGCGLVFLGSFIADLDRRGSSENYIGPEVILIFAGPPFLIGLLIWWLAARAGRG